MRQFTFLGTTYLGCSQNSDLLFERLPESSRIHGKLTVTGLNHLDYFLGKHASIICYKKVLKFISKISP
jgi:hypothetical protein